MAMLKLNQLTAGQEATVSYVMGDGPVSQRLLEMGMVPGASVKVTQLSPWGGPMMVNLDGYSLSLRSTEADLITLLS
ncbi:MAG: iron transporter [Deltaproteobacteria bacterium CG11_big_fil_rev_8_21_14_0_20_47_16]|nr:MAG: iron transporter [Deltaproteobacteria bacterium CG11_big_fil_rev_8_21_14_0_20_47_16]